jgi:hypothetical protein
VEAYQTLRKRWFNASESLRASLVRSKTLYPRAVLDSGYSHRVSLWLVVSLFSRIEQVTLDPTRLSV